jgi:predicted phosphoribosyltransferase
VPPFADRAEAGRVLGQHLVRAGDLEAPVVVALPRGGVPVGAELARLLGAPLVVMPVAKIGVPGHEELAVGAVAPGGVKVLNDDVLAALGLGEGEVEALAARAADKVAQQLQTYHYGRPPPSLEGRSAVVVDDGLATGATMKAALLAVRQLRPRRVVLAVPVASPAALEALGPLVDVCICPLRPPRMRAVSSWYGDFGQTTDAEVVHLLIELSG